MELKGSKPVRLFKNLGAGYCNNRHVALVLAWIRVASHAEYFWCDPGLLHGDVNALCVICFIFNLPSLQPAVNIKTRKSYVQFQMVRALRDLTALSSFPSLPMVHSLIWEASSACPWLTASFQGHWSLLHGYHGMLCSSSSWSCPAMVLTKLNPDKVLAWMCLHWKQCSSTRCPKLPLSSLSLVFLTYNCLIQTAPVMLCYHTSKCICLSFSVWARNVGVLCVASWGTSGGIL